jgi:hypothetical protein
MTTHFSITRSEDLEEFSVTVSVRKLPLNFSTFIHTDIAAMEEAVESLRAFLNTGSEAPASDFALGMQSASGCQLFYSRSQLGKITVRCELSAIVPTRTDLHDECVVHFVSDLAAMDTFLASLRQVLSTRGAHAVLRGYGFDG